VNVGGVGGEVRRRVIVGVVPGIDNVGDGCDAAAYAEYPWLCDLPDSTSAAGMHADMACCECGGGYIDGSGGLSSCQDQEGFLDTDGFGCDAYAEGPSWCEIAANMDYANVDGVHAGMACCECRGGMQTRPRTTRDPRAGTLTAREGSAPARKASWTLSFGGAMRTPKNRRCAIQQRITRMLTVCTLAWHANSSSPSDRRDVDGSYRGSTSTGATAVVSCWFFACTLSAGTTSGEISDGSVGPMKNYDNNAITTLRSASPLTLGGVAAYMVHGTCVEICEYLRDFECALMYTR
jgi:hypothetical protein